MKNIVLIFFTILLIVSCKNEELKKDNSIVNQTNTEDEHNHEEEVHLSPKQLASLSLSFYKIGKKNIRERIEVTGRIEVPPNSKATIYAPLEAFVHQTKLLPGDKVKKGQTIAVLQHPNFTKLQYDYLEAINKFEVKKADYERQKMLLESDITSKKSFQIAEGAYRSSKSLVNSYAMQLKTAGLSPTTVAKKGIQQYVYIKSPISGYITENNLNQGKFLTTNEIMAQVIDNDHMHAELNAFGADVVRLKKGDEFIFKSAGIDTEFEGYIRLISKQIDEQTKTVNIHGHFEDPKHLLKPGMFINAQVFLDKKNEEYAVPNDAIVEIDDENFVFMVKSKDEFIPLEVTVGNRDKGFTEIKTIEDNNFDIEIVTKGAHALKGMLMKAGGDMEGHAH